MRNETNTGDRNTGSWNTGSWNTGDWNTGHRNTGDLNTGNWNTGDWNTGSWNTGDRNTGDRNTGNWNTGHLNTGHCNTGDWNTGSWNTGSWNTGDRNTGDLNTGNWNAGNKSSATLSTIHGMGYGIFNTPMEYGSLDEVKFPRWMYFSLTEWVPESEMTDQEKKDNPTFHTCEGYLKSYDYKDAFRSSFDQATDEEKAKVMDLPHWNNEIFQEISGIDVEGYFASKREKRTIEIGGQMYDADEIEAKLKDLKLNG